MHILKPIARSRIPAHTAGRGDKSNSSFYDKIAIRTRLLPPNRTLPIVCVDGDECVNLMAALRNRKLKVLRRGLTVYAVNGKTKG